MADEDDEIILSELPDDELVLQMHDDLYDGLRDEVVEGVNILLGRVSSVARSLAASGFAVSFVSKSRPGESPTYEWVGRAKQ